MAEAQLNNTTERRILPGEGTDFPAGYVPSESEEYMSQQQLKYFRALLLDWKVQIAEEMEETLQELQEASASADLNDVASSEYDQGVELRTRDRERKLLIKIDEALHRIENSLADKDDGDGFFGYCEETGDPIGIPRLLARPIATLSIEAKRIQEKKEKGYAG